MLRVRFMTRRLYKSWLVKRGWMKWKSFNRLSLALIHISAHALHTLGLEKVWVACRCEAQMKEAERLLCPCSSADICIHLAGPEELAWGMALDAETKWFGTIYFCAQNPISPPL